MKSMWKSTCFEMEIEQAKKLVGFTVTGVAIDNNGEPYFGLVMKKGKLKYAAWINCDPEGNSFGHLEIQKL